jgi:hypothetical protein
MFKIPMSFTSRHLKLIALTCGEVTSSVGEIFPPVFLETRTSLRNMFFVRATCLHFPNLLEYPNRKIPFLTAKQTHKIKLFAESSFKTKYLLFLTKYVFPGYAMAQFVEALRYKPEGRGVDSRWCHWNFSLI